MSRFRTSGIRLRSIEMEARRLVGKLPIIGPAVPAHWRWSPSEMRAKLDELALGCDHLGSRTGSRDKPLKLWRTVARLCLQEAPSHLPAWRVLAYSCFGLERYEEAASAYRLLSAVFRDVEMNTALAFASRDDEERVSALHAAIEIDNSNPQSWMNLGYEFSHQERYKEAVLAFEKSASLSRPGTDQDIILFYIGMNLLEDGRETEATTSLIKAIELDKVRAFREFFDVQIADACVGHEGCALNVYDAAKRTNVDVANRFLSMFARRQIAFELSVKPWEVASEAIDEKVAAYGRSR